MMEYFKSKFKIYLGVSFLIFIVLFLKRYLFSSISISYGYGDVTLDSLFLLLFGIYLIFVSAMYFRNVFYNWKSKNSWKKDLFNCYLMLLLFVIFISLLSSTTEQPLEVFYYLKEVLMNSFSIIRLIGGTFKLVVEMAYYIGLSIAFPVSAYTLFLSIRSLIVSKKNRESYLFGVILLINSIILLIVSFISFVLVSSFWAQGGFGAFHI